MLLLRLQGVRELGLEDEIGHSVKASGLVYFNGFSFNVYKMQCSVC